MVNPKIQTKGCKRIWSHHSEIRPLCSHNHYLPALTVDLTSDEAEQVWVWEYETEEGAHDLYMDIGEEIRFRVVDETFVDTSPTGPSSAETSTSGATEEVQKKEAPYTLVVTKHKSYSTIALLGICRECPFPRELMALSWTYGRENDKLEITDKVSLVTCAFGVFLQCSRLQLGWSSELEG